MGMLTSLAFFYLLLFHLLIFNGLRIEFYNLFCFAFYKVIIIFQNKFQYWFDTRFDDCLFLLSYS